MQVLNLLLYSLRSEPPDYQLLEFLRTDEHLVDIGDDLVDYEVSSPGCPLKRRAKDGLVDHEVSHFCKTPPNADLLLQHRYRLMWPSLGPHAAHSASGPCITGRPDRGCTLCVG